MLKFLLHLRQFHVTVDSFKHQEVPGGLVSSMLSVERNEDALGHLQDNAYCARIEYRRRIGKFWGPFQAPAADGNE